MPFLTKLMGSRLLAGLLALLLCLSVAACNRQPEGEPSPEPVPVEATADATVAPSATPTATVGPTDTPTAVPVSEADLDEALATATDFLGRISTGDYRAAYGELLSVAGQERLAELVLGRFALTNPHISFFETMGAEPAGNGIAVDVTWLESADGQGDVGTQAARILLDREGDAFLIDDVELSGFTPAATPPPPALPRAELVSEEAAAGQEMAFRASGFQSSETLLTWLELADGRLVGLSFDESDDQGVVEATYPGEVTAAGEAGQWIWWVQALRDSSRNTGITFEVAAVPTPTPTTPPPPTPTQRPAPTAAPQPEATPTPTTAPAPSTAYGAPTSLWPERLTSREPGSALIVEFQPVAEQLAPDEFYELVLVAKNLQGTVYNAGSVQGKGDACSGQRDVPCRSLIGNERFMQLFYPSGSEATGEWFVQVVRETAPGQFTPISPPSETRVVILKP